MCDCIGRVTELMVKERDARLRTTINLTTGVSRVLLSFDTVPGKKKQKFNLLPRYCPFCGEPYEETNISP